MELTSAALWLNSAFSGYDSAVLSILHSVAGALGIVLTPLMKIITFLGEKGIIFFLLALILMCFSRTRRIGVCLFGAVCCGALITNVILKDMVARPRPFMSDNALFNQWWQFVGSPKEDGFSFPSGHVTAAAAGMTALSLMRGKKLVLPSVIVVLLMGISRNYLMAHYPSDALFAAVIGVASAFIAYYITQLIFRILEEHDDIPAFQFILDFDLPLRIPDSVLGGLAAVRERLMPGAVRGRPSKRAAEPTSAESRRTSSKAHYAPKGRAAGSSSKATGAYRGKHEK